MERSPSCNRPEVLSLGKILFTVTTGLGRGGCPMLLRRLSERDEIIALDDTRVRELLNPEHDGGHLVLRYSLAHAMLAGQEKSLPHRFNTASEVYFILKGRGRMYIDDDSAEVGPGDTIYIPPGSVQHIENLLSDDLEFLCIVSPPWTPDAEEKV